MTLADGYAITAFLITVDRLGLMSMKKYCDVQGFHIIGLDDPEIDNSIHKHCVDELWKKVEEFSDGS